MSVRRSMRTLGLVIVLAAGCADAEAPTWESEELAVGDVSASRIVVSWPAAEGASAYVVRIDGEPAARLGPEARTYAADELAQASEHAITVQALDDAGNESTALTATATTLDATAPSFPEGAELELTSGAHVEPDGEVDPTAPPAVVLRWPAASDNVAVTRYRVLRGEEELAAVDAPATSARIETASIEVRFEVRAIDAAGNESAPGLVGTYRAPEPVRDRDEEMRAAIEAAQAQVDQMLLGVLGTHHDGRFSDVFGGDVLTGNSADLLEQADGVGIATNSAPRHGGGGGGGLAGIHRPGSASIGELSAAPAPGYARLGAVQQSGGAGRLDVATVQRMLRIRLMAMRACYRRELGATPALAGTVRARFTVEPTGVVSSAQAVDSASPALDRCVIDTVRRLRFNPGSEGGPAIFETSVAFAPE